MGLISIVVLRALFPPDLPVEASRLLGVVVPSLVMIVATFITGDVYDGHSERKNPKK